MRECELSINFSYDLAKTYINSATGCQHITDYYIDVDTRFRIIAENSKAELTHKTGHKSTDRLELTSYLDKTEELEKIFKNKSKLTIHKTRYEFNGYTIDLVDSPLKIATLEIERDHPDKLIEYQAIIKSLDIKTCPLNAWNFHKRKIGIIGGPSSGKTSVAKSISLHLNHEFHANSSDVVEYATSFIQKHKRIPSIDDQTWIFIKQQERENTIASSTNIVLSDCPTFIAYIYAVRAMRTQQANPHTDYIMQALYKRAVRAIDDYDSLFILETLNYRQNNVRYHNLEQSKEVYNELLHFVTDHGRNHLLKQYNYNNTNNIINDILHINTNTNIKKLIERIEKPIFEVVAT